MSRYAVICFEHDHRTARENDPPCLDLDVDVSVPWSWVEATIGEVPISTPAKNRAESAVLAFEGTVGKIAALAERYQPTCPACKEPLRYTAWSVEDYEDD
jgi:hypothetical protein